MRFCYFAHFRIPDDEDTRLAEDDIARVAAIVGAVARLSRALVHVPAPMGTRHPFPRDEAPPMLALQLYANCLEDLESALRPTGALQALGPGGEVDGLRAARLQQQVMVVRAFETDVQPSALTEAGETCSYLVHYPGHAENLNAWLTHYLEHHPQIMRTLPHVREIEICTRVDWIGGLAGMRVDYMQRNKLVFNSPSELSESLMSPVIRTMRADFRSFPEFAGGNVHYPMSTRTVTNAETALEVGRARSSVGGDAVPD